MMCSTSTMKIKIIWQKSLFFRKINKKVEIERHYTNYLKDVYGKGDYQPRRRSFISMIYQFCHFWSCPYLVLFQECLKRMVFLYYLCSFFCLFLRFNGPFDADPYFHLLESKRVKNQTSRKPQQVYFSSVK